MKVSRREFISKICLGISSCPVIAKHVFASDQNVNPQYIREAGYYTKFDMNVVECGLCPNLCLIRDGKRGDCNVRENIKGTLNTLVYGRLCAMNNDPVEKKPLFHFLPGTNALSVATAGCNVSCKFCQNWNISQAMPEDLDSQYFSDNALVNLCKTNKIPTIAFTYSEPVIFFEYVYDVAVRARKDKIKSVMISNGYISQEPLSDLCNVLDAIKIDFKSFSDDFYRKVVSGQLQPVLDTMQYIKESGVWLEIVYLIIPGYNDSKQELQAMTKWIIDNLGPDVPVHFSRFYPSYLMKNLPPTSMKTMEMALDTARSGGVNYVYLGNVPKHEAENTYCPSCGKMIINRTGYLIRQNNLINGKCRFCDNPIAGIWE